jgi:hypothetical protein
MIKKSISKFNVSDYNKDTVIGEFSGRDSVAAIMKALENTEINFILPIATFAGTEYGDFDQLFENFIKMKEIVKLKYGNSKKIYPLMEYNREDIWHLMNGRYMAFLTDKFGYISQCIGCHLYFHLTKINFAKSLSGKVISGERESHDGRIKVNQNSLSLDFYKKVLNEFNIDLISPLRYMKNGDEVEKAIGFNWVEGENHPKCVLSGNYRNIDGKAIYDENNFKLYLENYLYPVGLAVGKYLLNEIKDIKELEKAIGSCL